MLRRIFMMLWLLCFPLNWPTHSRGDSDWDKVIPPAEAQPVAPSQVVSSFVAVIPLTTTTHPMTQRLLSANLRVIALLYRFFQNVDGTRWVRTIASSSERHKTLASGRCDSLLRVNVSLHGTFHSYSTRIENSNYVISRLSPPNQRRVIPPPFCVPITTRTGCEWERANRSRTYRKAAAEHFARTQKREKQRWFLKKPLIHFFFNTHYPDYWKWWCSWWLFLSRTNWICVFCAVYWYFRIAFLYFLPAQFSPQPLCDCRLKRRLGSHTVTDSEHHLLAPHQKWALPLLFRLDIHILLIILLSLNWRRSLGEGRTSQVVCDFCSFAFSVVFWWCFMFVCLLVMCNDDWVQFRSYQTQIENEDAAAGW